MTREQLEADLVRAAYALLAEMNAAGVRLPIPGGTILVERGDAHGGLLGGVGDAIAVVNSTLSVTGRSQ